jgi:RNA polymerase sigma factor (sigma-70 family)
MEDKDYTLQEEYIKSERKINNTSLINARKQSGLAMKEIAKRLRIKLPTYLSYEQNRHYPPKQKQKIICNFYRELGIPLVEEDTFPNNLKIFIPKRGYAHKKLIQEPELVSLASIPKSLSAIDNIETKIDGERISAELNEILSRLPYNQEETIRMRFGFDEGNEKTYTKISKRFHCSRETVRRHINQGLRKIRLYLKQKEYA